MHSILVLVNFFSHREFFEDLTPTSPEIEAFRKYTLPFEYALDIMGINDVSGHISFQTRLFLSTFLVIRTLVAGS